MNPVQIVEAVIGTILITMLVMCNSDHSANEAEIAELRTKVVIMSANNDTLSRAIEDQNAIIEAQRIKIANFKPVTVTEVLTKYVPTYINVERGDCNDTKNMLDVIRTIDPSKL